MTEALGSTEGVQVENYLKPQRKEIKKCAMYRSGYLSKQLKNTAGNNNKSLLNCNVNCNVLFRWSTFEQKKGINKGEILYKSIMYIAVFYSEE